MKQIYLFIYFLFLFIFLFLQSTPKLSFSNQFHFAQCKLMLHFKEGL